MLNKVVLIGRLTKAPDLRYTQSGVPVAKFNLAVDRGFKSQDGEKQVDFISVIAWRTLAENCEKYLAKGRLVAVSGRMQTRSYEAKDGGKRYVTEIVADEVQFLERKQDGQAQQPVKQMYPAGFTPVDDSENLPF